MIIADFIKTKKSEADVVFDAKLLDKTAKLKSQLHGIRDARDFGTTWQEKEAFDSFENRLNVAYNKQRGEMLAKHGELHKDFMSKDCFGQLSNSPKVMLSEARAIADKLNFVIIPFAYLDNRSYASETYDVKTAINSFTGKDIGSIIQSYVICPVEFYSVENHVSSGLDLPVYAPTSLAQTFMAIGISVPMFRAMKHEMNQMRNDVRNMDSRIQNLDQQVKNLSVQVQQLAVQVRTQLQQALIREAKAKEELRALETARFSSLEPMLLGLPTGTNIFDDKWAFMGPCWGPDFEDIVMAALELKPIKQQKILLEKNWGYDSSQKLKATQYKAYNKKYYLEDTF